MTVLRRFMRAAAAALLMAPSVSMAGQPESRAVLLFADVTSSLSPDEIHRVGATTSDVLATLPAGTRFAVYAIQMDPSQPPFAEGVIPTPKSLIVQDQSAARDKLKRLCEGVRNGIELLYCAYNFNDATAQKQCREKVFKPIPQEDLRSCILKRLGHAALKANELRNVGVTDVDLVFVSDMIEECQRTPLGHRTIRLTHTPLDADVAVIPKFRDLPDLSYARVTVIVPRSLYGASPERSTRPDIDELREYWQAVFRACHVNVKDSNRWYFGTEIPEHFKKKSLPAAARQR